MPTRLPKRLARAATLLCLVGCVAFVSSGCGALDELDKSAALMEGKKPAETAKAAGGSKGDGKQPKRLEWNNVKSVNSGDLDASITRCNIDGSVTFTRRDDCLSQGGTPAKI